MSPKPKTIATLAIDFDGVLHDYKNPVDGKRMGAPLPGALAAMDDLYDGRYELIIHTVKATTEQGRQMVEDWLDHYGFEYHKITAIKPNADYFIDDRAVHHTGDWSNTFSAIGFNPDMEDD